QAKSEADSLKNMIEGGIDFAIVATINSDDQGSAQLGGDLGWFEEGAMVKPFNDACFEGKKGDLTIAESQFGFHIIEILDQGTAVKKYKTGILDRKVEPGSLTYQNIYAPSLMKCFRTSNFTPTQSFFLAGQAGLASHFTGQAQNPESSKTSTVCQQYWRFSLVLRKLHN
ncbi:unnamed protein product, partial [marine sediment metagenome]